MSDTHLREFAAGIGPGLIEWQPRGCAYALTPEHLRPWSRTHTQIPTPLSLDADRTRIYFGTRDEENRMRITFVEVASQDPGKVLYIHDRFVMDLGRRGTFDDRGIMPGAVVRHNGASYLFYTGWNTATTVSYRLAIGIAVSDDGGVTFRRMFEGPVMDRSIHDPFMVCSPCVRIEDGVWKMWYISGTEWKVVNERTEPVYTVKYAESNDGLRWGVSDRICIPYQSDGEAIARPWVWKEAARYLMAYSFRGSVGYRTDPAASYRIGLAVSEDGKSWVRRDADTYLPRTEGGWDAVMAAYPSVYLHDGQRVLLYNGNGFGSSGFGWASSSLPATVPGGDAGVTEIVRSR